MASEQDQERRELRMRHWSHSQVQPAIHTWDNGAEVDVEAGAGNELHLRPGEPATERGLLRHGWVDESKRGVRCG